MKEYDKLFTEGKASFNGIVKDSPMMSYTIDAMVRGGAVVGQRELPQPVSGGDIVLFSTKKLEPIRSNGEDKVIKIDYVLFQQ